MLMTFLLCSFLDQVPINPYYIPAYVVLNAQQYNWGIRLIVWRWKNNKFVMVMSHPFLFHTAMNRAACVTLPGFTSRDYEVRINPWSAQQTWWLRALESGEKMDTLPRKGVELSVLIGASVAEYLSVFTLSTDPKRKWITWFELSEAGLGPGLLQTLLVVLLVLGVM